MARVSKAVDDAFGTVEPAIADDFLNEIRENWREVPSAVGRSITRALILIATFELMLRGAIAKISISGLEVTDLSLIRLSIPVIVAYLFYDAISTSFTFLDYMAVHDKILERTRPEIVRSDLVYFLHPRQPPIVGADFFASSGGRLIRLVQSGGNLLFALFLVAPVGFQAYAYQRQLSEFPDDPTWIAMVFSVLFTAYGYLILLSLPESSRR